MIMRPTNGLVMVSLVLAFIACNGEKIEYRDRPLTIDLTACLGAETGGPASTCREQISTDVSDEAINGCLIMAFGPDDDVRISHVALSWANDWFNLGPIEPITAAPGERVRAELYLFSKAQMAPNCEEAGLTFGTTCDAANPWCLIKLTQPETALANDRIELDFGGANGQCQTEGQLAANETIERCDGADNDCDGQIDESIPESGDACETGRPGVCLAGVSQCIDGAVVCVGIMPTAQELCDGLDDDCDGLIDNGFDVGMPCEVGLGLCLAQGVKTCTADGADTVCDAEALASAPEICDALDNDCDGVADEAYDLGSPCEVGVGICQQIGQVVCGGDGQSTCSASALAPADAESCNGLDDDCDGQIDEGMRFLNVGDACRVGVGICSRDGQYICTADGTETRCNVDPGAPAGAELCGNFLDDDCDGQMDEAEGLSTACTSGLGVCQRTGVLLCNDDDPTTLNCSAPIVQPTGDDINCDGLDDDCDGTVDESYVVTASECGVGACTTIGETVCLDGRPTVQCTARRPGQSDIACDGIDEDCDGQIDEGYQADQLSCGQGVCTRNVETRCVSGAEDRLCTPGQPDGLDTDCNGLDNDCDGNVDEGFVDRVTQCGTGLCQRSGTLSCVDGVLVDSCEVAAPGGIDNRCDGLDSDCDGRIDEDYRGDNTVCGFGCNSAGQMICQNGQVVDTCEPQMPVADNDITCDEVDDDCDGRIDENYTSPIITCGVGVCQRSGVNRCDDGVLVAECVVGDAGEELCGDTLDNDCDGQTDEGFAALGAACTAGLASCARQGILTCNAARDALICGAVAGPIIGPDTTCDGVDDDCDGTLDEHYTALQTSCGVGECGSTGNTSCLDGLVLNSCTPGQPIAEICDARDNDCDGLADEVCNGQPCNVDDDCLSGICNNLGSQTCEPADECGNGRIENDEPCDDGNTDNGDGCSDTCLRETGQNCQSDADCVGLCKSDEGLCVLDNTCGNGAREAGEICDDGNLDAFDGCADDCTIDAGFECDGQRPSTCSPITCQVDEQVQANACIACPAGSTNAAGDVATGADTDCEATLCAADERVVSNICTACPPGTTNAAGDVATGADTDCDATLCAVDEQIQANACTACPPGTTNAAGDNASGADTDCDETLCAADERVVSNICTACLAGSTNAAGDDATGVDTDCEATLCAADERVVSNICTACPAGSTNAAGDVATGADTDCDATLCGEDEQVQANACIACPAGTTNAAGDIATGPDTVCTAAGDGD